jgi:hypothetical protein
MRTANHHRTAERTTEPGTSEPSGVSASDQNPERTSATRNQEDDSTTASGAAGAGRSMIP